MLRKRGRNLRRRDRPVLGTLALDLDQHEVGACARRTEMRPTSSGQKLTRADPFSTRTCVQLVIDVDAFRR